MLFTLFLHLIVLPATVQGLATLDSVDGINYTPEIAGPERIYDEQLGVNVSASNWLVSDAETGKDLYSFRADEIVPIASITKLITTLVFLDTNPDLDAIITVRESDRVEGGTIRLHPGERLTLRNVLHSTLISSDNDAAKILQRNTGMNEEEFVKQMNIKAQSLGLASTIFTDPTGLDPHNVSTARDVTTLLKYALENEVIAKITSKPKYSFFVEEGGLEREIVLYSTNELEGSVYDISGGKTGFIEEAGYCLAVKATGDQGQELFITVLGSASKSDRFQDVKMLAEWVDRHYVWE